MSNSLISIDRTPINDLIWSYVNLSFLNFDMDWINKDITYCYYKFIIKYMKELIVALIEFK